MIMNNYDGGFIYSLFAQGMKGDKGCGSSKKKLSHPVFLILAHFHQQ